MKFLTAAILCRLVIEAASIESMSKCPQQATSTDFQIYYNLIERAPTFAFYNLSNSDFVYIRPTLLENCYNNIGSDISTCHVIHRQQILRFLLQIINFTLQWDPRQALKFLAVDARDITS